MLVFCLQLAMLIYALITKQGTFMLNAPILSEFYPDKTHALWTPTPVLRRFSGSLLPHTSLCRSVRQSFHSLRQVFRDRQSTTLRHALYKFCRGVRVGERDPGTHRVFSRIADKVLDVYHYLGRSDRRKYCRCSSAAGKCERA